MKKRLVAVLIGLTITANLLTACGNKPMPIQEEASALTVDMETAKKSELVITEDYVGTIEVSKETNIYPGTSGEITELLVSEGDSVSAGQILFKQDDESAQLSLKSAQASYAQTEATANKTLNSEQKQSDLEDQEELEDADRTIEEKTSDVSDAYEDYNNAVSDLDDAKADEEEAKEEYEEAQKKYKKAKQYLKEYEALQDIESAFEDATLKEAANMTAGDGDSNPSQSNIDSAKDLLEEVEDDDLESSDITTSGVESLESTRDSKKSAYESAQDATESASDQVTTENRDIETANRSLNSAYASKEATVSEQAIDQEDGIEDTKKVLDSQLASSAVTIESAQYEVDKCTTTAPVSGVIASLDVDAHDTVGTSTVAMTIVNNDTMNITFNVPEEVRSNLSIGQTISVTKNSNEYSAVITDISDSLGDSEGLFEITAQAVGNSDLLAGTTCTVTLDSYKDDSGIVIPYDAVYYSNGEPYIYVAKDGVAEKVDVTTGKFNSDSIVITSGLNVGDKVITSWSNDLKSGASVEDSAQAKVSSNSAVASAVSTNKAKDEKASQEAAE